MSDSLRLPSFIILGAQKAGTTSLHYALDNHKEIFMSEPKELSFFNIDANFERGVKWYASFFKHWANEKMAGESTPSYLWDERVPARMAKILPDNRFIIMLRNPVDRAYSAYWYAFSNGDETLPFAEAIEAEPLRATQSPAIRGYSSYIDRGLYCHQIKRFLKYYDQSQLLILITEEYKNDPVSLLSQVTRFLNVSCDREFIAKAKRITRNVARIPRLNKVHRYIPSLMERSSFAARVIRRLNLRKAKYPPMPADIRLMLLERFRDSNEELEDLLGRKLYIWNQ